jgi:hypothetical protein
MQSSAWGAGVDEEKSLNSLEPNMPKKRAVFSSPGLKRTNFFNGRLLTAEDLQREQECQRAMLRQANRAAFGQGLVRGLNVSCSGTQVSVTPGMAVDATGRILELPDACSFDLRRVHGLWDLVIEMIDVPCDPVPIASQGNGADNNESFSLIQEIVKLNIIQISEDHKRTDAIESVWLGTIQSLNGTCQVVNLPTRDGCR